MIETKDVYWLAGILEGEGCFSRAGKYRAPRVQLKMVDLDVVEKVNRILRPQIYRKNGNVVACHPCNSPGNRQANLCRYYRRQACGRVDDDALPANGAEAAGSHPGDIVGMGFGSVAGIPIW